VGTLATDYYQVRHDLSDKGIIFSFVGYVSEAALVALGDALRKKMAVQETDANTAKRVFSVFVEQVQNIIRYSAERLDETDADTRLSSGVVTVGAEDGRFFVVCGNTIRREGLESLRTRLDQIAGLDKQELKALYKEKLREPPEAESEGATVGLIEIARRASEPIEFDFTGIDDEYAFFCLKTYI